MSGQGKYGILIDVITTKCDRRYNMSLSFCSFSSGSSGNCYMVFTETTAVLVDAGISGKRIMKGIDYIQADTDSICALLITHEHIDHVRSVRVLNKKLPGLKTYANEKTWEQIDDLVPEEKRRVFSADEEFEIGDMTVRPFRTSHDAVESVGFSFYSGGRQVSIVTDTGYISDEMFASIRDADILVIEANHDVNVLQMCSYPYQTKRRIAGDFGHLSNEAAADCICRITMEYPKDRQVLLAHLSNENNSPSLAHLTIKNILEENRLYIDRDLRLSVISRDEISPVYIAL